jgi:hypothetical protein
MRSHFFKLNTLRQDKKYEKYLNACREDLGKWFGVNVLMPHVFFIQSRKDFDKIRGCKTEPWMTAVADRGNIYIMDLKVYTKETSNTDAKRFWLVLKHEYTHLYYRAITNSGNPRWLNEGLACYLATQVKKTPDEKVLLGLDKFFDEGGEQVYGVGFFWVNYLVESYGKNKLLKLIKTIDSDVTKSKFNANFKSIYGFGLNKGELKKVLKD